jgi:predicted dehydrogenase
MMNGECAMTAKIYKVGVIGAGAIAQALHIPGYAKAENCELTAICDVQQSCLDEVKEAGHDFASTYSDWQKMLAEQELDVVSICTPNCWHKDMAIACLEKGIDLLLEKPIAMTLDEATEILAAAEKSSSRVMVGFSHRFQGANVAARKAVQEGKIGKLYMARIRFAHTGPIPGWAKSDWFYKQAEAGGGALLDMGIHAFDLIQWMVGSVTAVNATVKTLRKDIEVDDNAIVNLEFGEDCLGYIDVGWTSPSGFLGVELMGDNGSIIVDYNAEEKAVMTVGTMSPDGTREMEKTVLFRAGDWEEEGWPAEMTYFTGALDGDKPFDITLQDGLAALKVAVAAQQSSDSGSRVVID